MDIKKEVEEVKVKFCPMTCLEIVEVEERRWRR